MTRLCAWCGEAVPKRARGRPGARAFCRKEHSAAFYAAARALGAIALDRAIRADDWEGVAKPNARAEYPADPLRQGQR